MHRQPPRRRRRRSLRTTALSLILTSGLLAFGSGCASSALPPPVTSDTKLGRVIIYRNGVAYFERYAGPREKQLTMRVPSERVDDFLKSLTVVDEKTGKTMPVSFPTLEHQGGEVMMTIALPKGHNRLRISYVTESPAWKPSYRVMLNDDGKAKLQGWAVVDNVSGEDWQKVKVGVGSTSALSFRYDLHSVRVVERETLSGGSLVAVAPPTGGTPYATPDREPVELANVSQSALAAAERTRIFAQKTSGGSTTRVMGSKARPTGASIAADRRKAGGKAGRQHRRGAFRALAHRLKKRRQKIRIEGYAKDGDRDPRSASLTRANLLRDQLIANGIPAGQLEAVGTGKIDNQQAARLVEADVPAQAGEAIKPDERVADGKRPEERLVGSQPLGQAHFVSSRAMTIENDHSAMVNILDAATEAERVYYYDPVSRRGSKHFAFNAIRIVNPSRYTLDSGPFTVYARGQFLGEGLSDPILPHSTAFVPFALDRSIVAEPKVVGDVAIDRLVTIQRGIVTTEARRIRRTKLSLSNRGKQAAKVYVRHKVADGYTLGAKHRDIEKLAGAHLFPVEIPPGQAVMLEIEEHTPITKTVDIRTDGGIKAMGLFLRKSKLEPQLLAQLQAVVDSQRKRANLEQRIRLLGEQMGVYRTRVDEINVQLVTLRKVPQAARLRLHLAQKMEEISDKLQQSTIEMSELEGALMTLRIDLQDKLAELKLEAKKDDPKLARNDRPEEPR
jgi:hypothetical protein